MSSLRDVFAVLEQMRDERVVSAYAIGGATAVLFYAEPTRTYDVDVFVTLPADTPAALSLAPVYSWALARGIASEGDHLIVEGVPVQVLPAYNRLVEDAVAEARVHDYEGVLVRVVGPEHLVALALQAGGARRRERAWQLIETGGVDGPRLRRILDTHAIVAEIPDDV